MSELEALALKVETLLERIKKLYEATCKSIELAGRSLGDGYERNAEKND